MKQERVYILSHTDLDGYISAGLIEYFHTYKAGSETAVTVKHKSWTYGRSLPDTSYIKKKFDVVYVVDICPDKEFMFNLYEHFEDNLIWIDHHISKDKELYDEFVKAYPDYTFNGKFAEREHETAAVSLVYKYFKPERDVPAWIKYISDFDCWNRTDEKYWQDIVMPYMIYLKHLIINPANAVQYIQEYNIIEEGTDVIILAVKEISEGRLMYKELLSIYKAEAKHGFERILTVEIDGCTKMIKAWICNTQNRSSVIFEQMPNKNEYDVFIPFHYNGSLYLYSMYTWKPNISCNGLTIRSVDNKELTDKLTFMGHTDAAGVRTETFIF